MEGGRWGVVGTRWSGRPPCGLHVKKKPAIQRSREGVLDRKASRCKGPMETEFGVLESRGECGPDPGERREREKGTGKRSAEQISGGLQSCSRACSLRAVRGTWDYLGESIALSA